jgi:hypothetical protein
MPMRQRTDSGHENLLKRSNHAGMVGAFFRNFQSKKLIRSIKTLPEPGANSFKNMLFKKLFVIFLILFGSTSSHLWRIRALP